MGLNYKDMVGMIKPTVHVDEFASKIGNDDEFIVLSFYVRNNQVADDLVEWFEKGYEHIIDADRSPGEIKTNRYLVYVEILRRTRLAEQLNEMLDDLNTLTEFEVNDWVISHNNESFPFDADTLSSKLELSPHKYRQSHEGDLNEMRVVANIPVKEIYDNKKDAEINTIRQQAGLL